MGVVGEFKYPDGSIYQGSWNDQGSRHGYGVLSLADGSHYQGNFEQGYYGGLGVINFTDGTRYSGEFEKGKFHGYGVFVRGDGMRYEGEFKDGKMWGQGLVTFSDGTNGLPRNEGYFEGTKIIRREKCGRSIKRARDMAGKARETTK